MCPPGLNDIAAENLAIIMRVKCFSEIADEIVLQPTLQEILEFG